MYLSASPRNFIILHRGIGRFSSKRDTMHVKWARTRFSATKRDSRAAAKLRDVVSAVSPQTAICLPDAKALCA